MNWSGHYFSPRRVAGKAYEYELLILYNSIAAVEQYYLLYNIVFYTRRILFALHLSYKHARRRQIK